MKKWLACLIFLGLAGCADATKLTYTDIFSECREDMSYLECYSRFFVPNLHLTAAKILLWDSITSISDVVLDWFSNIGSFLGDPEFSFEWIIGLLTTLLFGWIIGLLDYVVGIISGIVVFIIILGLEFIKDYLLISTMWICTTRALGSDAEFFSLNRAVLIGALMVVGSIWLLLADWGNVIADVIG